jgi:ribosome biogenesis GTPase / thiamine phosphate phosphatase
MSFEIETLAQLRPGQQLARVCANLGDQARVKIEGVEWDAVIAGALSYAAQSSADLPVTGDWVAVRQVEARTVLIEHVFPRRSWISRRAAGRRDVEQMLAANVDLAFLVTGLDGDYNPRRLERYLAVAREGGVEPVIVLNKADVCAEASTIAEEVRHTLRVANVLPISARSGLGCDRIQAMLAPGLTAVLLGSSGAGKSTLLNRLLGTEVNRTQPVRESDSRGRHTTTHRQLIELPSGAALIDTPGLREIQLWAGQDSIAAVFDDIEALAVHCRFRDCTHSTEPGCAVRDTVDPGRLHSYHKLRQESLRHTEMRTEKQRWRSIHKAARQFYKLRGH